MSTYTLELLMTDSFCHRQASPASDHGQALRLLSAAGRLFAQLGPSVTLRDIAVEASTNGGEVRCSEVIEALLAQRLGDLLNVTGALSASQTREPRATWAETVREIVLEHLDRPGLSLGRVARILAVSPRTLQRRLADEGTSWRAILDVTRHERAAGSLREGATVDSTAAQVGYAGGRALRRALRRWRENPPASQVTEVGVSSPQLGASGPRGGCRRLR